MQILIIISLLHQDLGENNLHSHLLVMRVSRPPPMWPGNVFTLAPYFFTDLLRTLPSRSPTRLLLPAVTCANRTRRSLVQKQRRALFFHQKRRGASSRSKVYSPRQAVGRACCVGFFSARRRRSSRGSGAGVLLRFQMAVPGTAAPSLPTAHQSEVSALFHTRDSGLKGQVQGLCMTYTMCKSN